ncbi:MAG: MBL fold metallo-hydrolase [Pseudomonadales bacterium]
MLLSRLNAKPTPDPARNRTSEQFKDGRFHNAQQHVRKGKWYFFSHLKRLWLEKKAAPRPQHDMPIDRISKIDLFLLPDNKVHVFRLGHASLLLKLGEQFWLIDPVFSKRASPFQCFGPTRFHPSPIELDQLPPITGVIISHNHYDHLDKHSIAFLSQRAKFFLAPLGVDGDLVHWGVRRSQITTLDWWQTHSVGSFNFTLTPAHHYSGRGFNDNSSTLWGSWVIQALGQSLYFSGDSGYFAGFKEIGERFPKLDLCLIENGAYDLEWPYVHMQPEQSLQAFLDLGGKRMMPIHNATFDLAFHPWHEPMERMCELADNTGIELLVPRIGQRVSVGEPLPREYWWRGLND